jgi:hypothetical protein
MTADLSLELVRYRAWFETRAPLHFIDYLGSAWRGAFGHALKNVACTQRGGDCPTCPERSECPYPPLFETSAGAEPFRPYIFEPQALTGYFLSGSLVGLDLVVCGWLNRWVPLLHAALQQLGERGLGVRDPVHLTLIELQQQVGATGEGWISLWQPGAGEVLPLPPSPFVIPPAPRCARLDLITPLRLKYRSALVQPDRFTAKDLLVALARRFEAAAPVLAELPLPPEPEQWLAEADQLVECAELHWHDTHHYSSRQHEALKLGGLMGHLVLRGAPLERIWLWLWLGQWLHLGSSTTIGLGRYVVREV